jgi:hypothetical protein
MKRIWTATKARVAVRRWSPRAVLLLVAVVISAVGLGYGIRVATAADPRLDEADLTLEKAHALLAASQSGGVSDHAQHEFDKAVGRAMTDVDHAREEIAEAKAAVDNP